MIKQDTQHSTPSQANLLNHFDFSQIEQLDPSLNDNFRLVFEKTLQFQVRFSDGKEESKELSAEEPLRVRLFISGEDYSPEYFRIECNCESDLFFHYSQLIDEGLFNQIREEQELQVSFKDYPTICMKSLNRCEKEPLRYAYLL